MTSPRQLHANRQNALRSKGPRTGAGKARSRFNALQHGLTARHVLLPGESREGFEEFRRAAFDSLRPQDAIEKQLAERLVTLLWRLRRIPVIEAAIYEWTAQWHGISAEDDTAYPDGDNQVGDQAAIRDDIDEFNRRDRDDRKALVSFGRVFEALFEKDFIGKLSRYEMSLQKQLAMTLIEYLKLSRNRSDLTDDGAVSEVHRPIKPLRKRYVRGQTA